jgi:hypothetical protein
MQYVRQREREMMGLDKVISRCGFIMVDDYKTKLRIMDHPLFLFGFKLFEMPESVELFDADFCNVLVIKSFLFEDLTLNQVTRLLNRILQLNHYKYGLMEVGRLKDISDF